jgi:hypothetical protein
MDLLRHAGEVEIIEDSGSVAKVVRDKILRVREHLSGENAGVRR